MNKYIWAAGACVGVFSLGVILELSLGYNSSTQSSFGWMFRQLCFFSVAIFVWRAITKKKTPAVKTQTSANNAVAPVKETKLPVHEPMLTFQPTGESLEPAVGSSNACPACGVANPADVKFCESCGNAFYRNCPECGRESGVKKQYCGGCGTDMDGFLVARQILKRMEACKEEKNLRQIIRERQGAKDDTRLPGPKGKKLRAGIEETARNADNVLRQIERLEKEIELLCSAETAKHSDLNGGSPTISDDRKLLRRLDEHYWLRPFFSEKLRMLEKEAKARITTASKIRRRRRMKIIAGIAVGVVLVLAGMQPLLNLWRAEELKQLALQKLPSDLMSVTEAEYAPLNGVAARFAKAAQRAALKSLNLPIEVKSAKTGIAFRLIPAGSFIMGDRQAYDGASHALPAHQVTISKPFYCGKFEITQEQWTQVMGTNPSHFANAGNNLPVETVSWEDCQQFLKKLCGLEDVSQGTYRLLTEAEWEYSCRAGTSGNFGSYYKNVDALAWYDENSGGQTHPVGMLRANGWGLYDMRGNVWEWCEDWFGAYSSESVIDPRGPSSSTMGDVLDRSRGVVEVLARDHVSRGGSFQAHYGQSLPTYRGWTTQPAEGKKTTGFRILRVAPQP